MPGYLFVICVKLPGVLCADLPLRNEYKLKLEYLFFMLLFCKFLGLCSVLSPCVCLFAYVCGLDLNSQQAFAATDGRSDCKSFPHVQCFTHAATTAWPACLSRYLSICISLSLYLFIWFLLSFMMMWLYILVVIVFWTKTNFTLCWLCVQLGWVTILWVCCHGIWTSHPDQLSLAILCGFMWVPGM